MIKVAIIGLGIMGRRMLQHMRIHEKFEPNYLWDPDKNACQKAIEIDSEAKIMNSPEEAIDAADLVYLACPPRVREAHAIGTARKGKALFLEKPLGIDIHDSRSLINKLKDFNVPLAVNFTQAAGPALNDLIKAKSDGDLGEMIGVDIIVTYPHWPRKWQKEADWLRFNKEGGMTREVISHFLFFSERVLGSLELKWAKVVYPKDERLCETDVLARLETKDGKCVNILGSVGGAQPDRQELTVRGTAKSRRISEFYRDSESNGIEFIPLRKEPKDPRAVSLGAQLDDLEKVFNGHPNKLATVDEALRVQVLIESILAST
ncbi:Gfo/Idh/MocA family oxidoreductase [Paracoccaceae bacterium]|nr:Gfo/Idh/MocA family oxidoreductase [Paracoccaceae bacterium]